ncbi:MAG: WhiB family transcriptional regulator [Actinomycetota bacterium]
MAVEKDWQERGACRGIDVDLFFPVVEHEAVEAKAICSMCPVQSRCLEFSIAAGERFGIWGGLTTQERKDLMSARLAVGSLAAGPSVERAPERAPVPG